MAEPELVEPEEQLSSQAASASITADAPESLRNVRRSYRFMGVLLSIKPRTQGECARGKQGVKWKLLWLRGHFLLLAVSATQKVVPLYSNV